MPSAAATHAPSHPSDEAVASSSPASSRASLARPSSVDVPDGGCLLDSLPDAQLADVLAFVLRQLYRRGDGGPPPHAADPAALFFSRTGQTGFTLSYYCERLLLFMGCTKACYVLAMLYLARLADRWPVFALSELNVHRLVCTAVVLAAKWVEDEAYSNAHYARVAGVRSVEEMSRMEAHMLACLDFRLHVDREYYCELERNVLFIAENGIHLQVEAEEEKLSRWAT